jgi:hypothetical protein
MKTKTIATIIGAVLWCTCTVQVAQADTWIFKDVLRPNGHERSMKAKFADAHRCGAVGDQFSDDVLPNMQQCMWEHGWRLDHIVRDPSPRYAHARSFPHSNNGWNEDDEELRKRNEDAANDAERQRDEEARSDEFQQQMQDQINTDAAISALNNGQ